MVAYFQAPDDPMVKMNWEINGSYTTLSGLEALDEQTRIELVDWVINLPFGAVTKVNDRFYIMVHAGIRPTGSLPQDQLTSQGVKDLLLSQDPEDLLWIREEFWSVPTGLIDENGVGPIVIAGHTPTAYLEGMANYLERSPQGEDGLCRQVKVGACEATGGVADRWDIDSGAAGGAGFGQVSMVRLDDGEEFYEPIAEGE